MQYRSHPTSTNVGVAAVTVRAILPSMQSANHGSLNPIARETRSFHLRTGLACAILLVFSVVGSRLTAVRTPQTWNLLLAFCLCMAALMPIPIYWHDKRRPEMREAALTILWAVAVIFTLPPAVYVFGRAGMPLQDVNLMRLDSSLGISVPAIAQWAAHHALGRVISATYPLLFLFIPLALLAPALSGRWLVARQFIAANIVAYVIGLAAFALLPAVGPWYGYHLVPEPAQALCQAELLTLRAPGLFIPHTPGIVCFPSFHVIWALLSARALWTFRRFRILVAIFAAMIVLSTLTTGWHYFVDVLGGIAVSAISVWAASALRFSPKAHAQVSQNLSPAQQPL